jgi:pimeloyl-ACP methyl ester carboxylesterase
MSYYPEIYNVYGERLDTIVEGKDDATKTIIFVHGFATDKHETNRYFDDLSIFFGQDYRVVRFDFSGCGKSGGKLQEKDYGQWKGDLKSIVDFTKNKYPGETYILAQSMGCFVTAMLNPQGIVKTVFTGLPNSNVNYLIDRLVERFGNKEGAKIDFENISIFPRSSGVNQLIGPTFWKVLRLLKPVSVVAKFSENTRLMVIHPDRDEIVGQMYLAQYASIPGVVIKKLHGDHSFKNQEDRKALGLEIKNFFDVSGP